MHPTHQLKQLARLFIAAALLLGFTSPGTHSSAQAAAAQLESLPFCSGSEEYGCNDLQVILIIDDSNSMIYNDPNKLRFSGAENAADILAEKYLAAVEAQAADLPEIHVAAIHFGQDAPLEYVSGWIKIAPESRTAWEQQTQEIRDLLVPPYVRTYGLGGTDFVNPFHAAECLLPENAGAADCAEIRSDLAERLGPVTAQTASGCPNRIVLVLTDGTPSGAVALTGEILTDHMRQVREIARRSFAGSSAKLYLTAIGSEEYWAESLPHWEEITGDDPEDSLARLALVQNDTALASRMENIIASNLGYLSLSVDSQFVEIPPYLESLRVTYFAPSADASLNIFKPDGSLVSPNSAGVSLTGAGTAFQVLEILAPPPGSYRFVPSLPGGSINLILRYPEPGSLRLENTTPILQQFTEGVVSFRLLNHSGSPLQAAENAPLRFSTVLAGQPVEVAFTGEVLSIPFLPLAVGGVEISLDVMAADADQQSCILYQGTSQVEIDPVSVQAVFPDAFACAEEATAVAIPLQVINERSGQPTGISLPVAWQVEAPIQASVSEVNAATGSYTLELVPANQEIPLSLSANVASSGSLAEFYRQELSLPGAAQAGRLALVLDELAERADSLSVTLNRWFGQIPAEHQGEILVGRKLFGWLGAQPVSVQARYVDADSGESAAGIERFWLQLVPEAGSAQSEPSNAWQSAAGDSYQLSFAASALGAYTLTGEDRGAAVACVQVDTPPTRSILLIAHWSEYLFWLILILFGMSVIIWLVRGYQGGKQEREPTPDKPASLPASAPEDQPEQSEKPFPPGKPEQDQRPEETEEPEQAERLADQKMPGAPLPPAETLEREQDDESYPPKRDQSKPLPPQEAAQERSLPEIELPERTLAPFVPVMPPPGAPDLPPAEQEPTSEEEKENEEKQRDDLTILEGIGPKVEQLLNQKGIKTFKQLAGANPEEIMSWTVSMGWDYMYPQTWIPQAKLAADGDWDGLNKMMVYLFRGRYPGEPGKPARPD